MAARCHSAKSSRTSSGESSSSSQPSRRNRSVSRRTDSFSGSSRPSRSNSPASTRRVAQGTGLRNASGDVEGLAASISKASGGNRIPGDVNNSGAISSSGELASTLASIAQSQNAKSQSPYVDAALQTAVDLSASLSSCNPETSVADESNIKVGSSRANAFSSPSIVRDTSNASPASIGRVPQLDNEDDVESGRERKVDRPLAIHQHSGRRAVEFGEPAATEVFHGTLSDLDSIAEATLTRCSRNDKALRALDISDMIYSAAFYSELAAAMQHNTVLQELYLDNCGIDDEALRVLSKGMELNRGSALRVLSLEDNNIKCVGVSYLARAMRGQSRWARSFGGFCTHAAGPGRGLRYLSLKANAVSSIGAKAISEALMASDDSLARLSFEANRVDDWGAGWFAVALRNHNVLECLDLHRNPIGLDGAEELKSACQTAKASLILLREVPVKSSPDVLLDSECRDAPQVSDAEEFREECVTLVEGQRLTTVFLSDIPYDKNIRKQANHNRQTCAYARPGSASRRKATLSNRLNGQLDIEEPAGSVMVDSFGTTGTAAERQRPASPKQSQTTEQKRPPSPIQRNTKVSVAALACNSATRPDGLLRPASHRAASVGHPSTYMSGKSNPLRDARVHPGERAPGSEEMETSTALAPPSRWRRKLSAYRTGKRRDAAGGGGAVAAKSLRRSRSTPGQRCGMLLGPQAASGMYGCFWVGVC